MTETDESYVFVMDECACDNFKIYTTSNDDILSGNFRIIKNSLKKLTLTVEDDSLESQPILYKNLEFSLTLKLNVPEEKSTDSTDICEVNSSSESIDVDLWANNISPNHWSFYAYCIEFFVKPIVQGCHHESAIQCKCIDTTVFHKYDKQYNGVCDQPENLFEFVYKLQCEHEEFYCTFRIKHMSPVTLYPNYGIFKSSVEEDAHVTLNILKSDDNQVLCKFDILKSEICSASNGLHELLANNEICIIESHGRTADSYFDLIIALLPPYVPMDLFELERLEFFCYFSNKYQCNNLQIKLTDHMLNKFDHVTLITIADKHNMTRMLCSTIWSMSMADVVKVLETFESSTWSDKTKLLLFERVHVVADKQKEQNGEQFDAQVGASLAKTRSFRPKRSPLDLNLKRFSSNLKIVLPQQPTVVVPPGFGAPPEIKGDPVLYPEPMDCNAQFRPAPF